MQLTSLDSEQKLVESSNSNLYNNASTAILNAFLMYRMKYSRVPQFSNSVCSVEQCIVFAAKKQLHVPLLGLTLKAEYKSPAKIICACISRRGLLCVSREMFSSTTQQELEREPRYFKSHLSSENTTSLCHQELPIQFLC